MQDAQAVKLLRKKIFLTGYKGGMAHLASCYSCLEILYALYCKGILRLDPQQPKWPERDRFILSKGHAGLALYAVLMQAGLLAEETFDAYLAPGSHIGGEPCMRDCDWVEASTGSLGHGLSFAAGTALALQENRSAAHVYVLLGDGECEEGTVWEAAMSAAAFGLKNLTAILDCNEIQKMDRVDRTIGRPAWREKWSAFGWDVAEVDGHDIQALCECLPSAAEQARPRLIIAHTVKGKGVSIMENDPKWHFKLPASKRELRAFQQELGVTDAELE